MKLTTTTTSNHNNAMTKHQHQPFNSSLIISSPVVVKSQSAEVEIDNAFLTSENDFATQEEMMRVKAIYQNIYGGSPNGSLSYNDSSLSDIYNNSNQSNPNNNVANWKTSNSSNEGTDKIRLNNSLEILMEIDNVTDPLPPSSNPSSLVDSTSNSTFGNTEFSISPLDKRPTSRSLHPGNIAVMNILRKPGNEKEQGVKGNTLQESFQKDDGDTSSDMSIVKTAQLGPKFIHHAKKTAHKTTKNKATGKRKPRTPKPKAKKKRKIINEEVEEVIPKPQLLITLKFNPSNDDGVEESKIVTLKTPPSTSSFEARLDGPESDDVEYKPGTRQTRSKRRRIRTKEEVYIPEKKRRLGPRSKSGCWTCRVRHKACPEDRPICGQCIRLHLPCDYSNERPIYMTDPLLQAAKLKEIRDVTNLQKKINFAKRRNKD
ncbi:hypothetical protein DFJ63DRAFT_311465 [Scheffersomyces coipomensis]|uniref:uncharacterized protein n=1 Tax=Scheffersomyces coipomensis TaxID=1788519 RepID=UPI00315DDC23